MKLSCKIEHIMILDREGKEVAAVRGCCDHCGFEIRSAGLTRRSHLRVLRAMISCKDHEWVGAEIRRSGGRDRVHA